jgi:hypothetical protein
MSKRLLHITNYFHGHWEDPEWGRRPVNQILVSLAIRELANGIQDAETREQIHTITDKVVSGLHRTTKYTLWMRLVLITESQLM